MKAEWDRGYRLQGRKNIQGIKIAIENKKGSVRKGVDPDGKQWKVKMNYPYGRIMGSIGKDKDHVDGYVGPNENASKVFVVHQRNPFRGGVYDEDKAMIGFDDVEDAKTAYLEHYNRPDFLGEVTEFTIPEFKQALKSCKGRRLQKKVSTEYGKV
jgi:hypothetical protein